MELDLSSLENAISHFKRYHAKAEISKNQGNFEDFDAFRAATIKAFEYCYEIYLKMMRRYLELTEDRKENVDELGFRDRIRLAKERALITDPGLWFLFREKRNISSHTYEDEKAKEVYEIADDFEKEIAYLLMQLKSRNV